MQAASMTGETPVFLFVQGLWDVPASAISMTLLLVARQASILGLTRAVPGRNGATAKRAADERLA
jgi:hypothetical protein